MIRKYLQRTREATFCVELPNKSQHNMPMPTGTGFFISPDGWFVTAAHVISEDGTINGRIRSDVNEMWLMKEHSYNSPGAMCQFVNFEYVLPQYDFALLRVDFKKNSNKAWLENKDEFPYLQISQRQLEMGEPVYSFGYPLSTGQATKSDSMVVAQTQLSPRVTSAIVSSNLDKTQALMTERDPKNYVLDKALNYGNSGGPIIAVETGCVHAVCSRFQPVFIPQNHLTDSNKNIAYIMAPSLYSVVSSLGNKPIIDLLMSLGVNISED